jgi:quercetin dioxygenase-like cupin family protein
MRAILAASVALLFGTALAQAAAQPPPDPNAPKVSVEPVARTSTTLTGEPITVPANPTVAVGIVTFPPGAALPVHRHPYPHYVYVLEGVLTVTNVETGKTFTVKKGGFFVETNTAWHFGKNEGSEPVKLLAIDQLPAGITSNMELPPAK